MQTQFEKNPFPALPCPALLLLLLRKKIIKNPFKKEKRKKGLYFSGYERGR